MFEVIIFFVISKFNQVFCEIYIDNYRELSSYWEYNSSRNYTPSYSMYGDLDDDMTLVPNVPYDDEYGNPEELPPIPMVRIFNRIHLRNGFMSINAPNYDHFTFLPPLDTYIPPASCNYPKIGTILNETFGMEQAGNFSNSLKKVIFCSIEYYWMDFGYNQYPRYILQGFCKMKTSLTSKSCRPCDMKMYSVLSNNCMAGSCRWMRVHQNLLTWCSQF